MPRPREREGQTLDKMLNVRFSEKMLAFIDSRKGSGSRGAYLRALVRADAEGKVRR